MGGVGDVVAVDEVVPVVVAEVVPPAPTGSVTRPRIVLSASGAATTEVVPVVVVEVPVADPPVVVQVLPLVPVHEVVAVDGLVVVVLVADGELLVVLAVVPGGAWVVPAASTAAEDSASARAPSANAGESLRMEVSFPIVMRVRSVRQQTVCQHP